MLRISSSFRDIQRTHLNNTMAKDEWEKKNPERNDTFRKSISNWLTSLLSLKADDISKNGTSSPWIIKQKQMELKGERKNIFIFSPKSNISIVRLLMNDFLYPIRLWSRTKLYAIQWTCIWRPLAILNSKRLKPLFIF